MNRIEELISVLDRQGVKARGLTAGAQGICKICEKPAVAFRTAQAKLEYKLSMICQSCQDYYLSDEL